MRSVRRVPCFSLYGEQPAAAGQADCLHIEDIPSRSRKYLWRIGAHRHTALYQCLAVTAGPVTTSLDGSASSLAGPALILIPAGTVHSFRFRSDTRGYVLTVNLDRLLSASASLYRAAIGALFSAPRVIDLRADERFAGRIERLLECLHQEFRQPEARGAPISGWLACSVLWLIAGARGAYTQLPSSTDADRMRRFRLLLESRLLQHWPVERYAQQLGLSEACLNRLCRRLAGSTAFELMQQRLALEARRRLVYAGGSVAGISAELGFTDPAYFCRFFRRHNGVSPSLFRRRHTGG